MEIIGESVKIKKIAISGFLSTGKSTVCDLLKEEGAYVMSTDVIVHNLLLNDSDTIQEIEKLFGKEVISQGKIDRKKLANVVFQDPKKLESLEHILHPKVINIIKSTYQNVKHLQQYKAFAVEIPLVFEIGFDSWFDEVISVIADIDICKKRFIDKGFRESEFSHRLKRFLPEEERLRRSHHILVNNQSISSLKEAIKKLSLGLNHGSK